jgi:hypothetical protein
MTKSVLLCILVCSAAALRAQPVGTEPAPAPPTCAVRAWFFPGADQASVALRLRRPNVEEPVMLGKTVGGTRSAPPFYGEQPAGNASFERVDTSGQVLATVPAALRGKMHYTLLASRTGGGWKLETLIDTVPPNAADRPLRVVNFARGRETILEFSPEKVEKIAPDSSRELRMPPKTGNFNVKVLAPDGGPAAETVAEIDYSEFPVAYVVVGPDHRDRMRPEVIPGGAPKATPTPPPVAPVEFDLAQERVKEREARVNAAKLERGHLQSQMAILKAQIAEGVNVPENAAELQSDLEKRMKDVEAETRGASTPATPAVPAPAPAN